MGVIVGLGKQWWWARFCLFWPWYVVLARLVFLFSSDYAFPDL